MLHSIRSSPRTCDCRLRHGGGTQGEEHSQPWQRRCLPSAAFQPRSSHGLQHRAWSWLASGHVPLKAEASRTWAVTGEIGSSSIFCTTPKITAETSGAGRGFTKRFLAITREVIRSPSNNQSGTCPLESQLLLLTALWG